MALCAAAQDVTCYILPAMKSEEVMEAVCVFVRDAGRSCQTPPRFPFGYSP